MEYVNTRSERIQARVKPGTRQEIQALAERERRTEADMIRILVEEALTNRAAAVKRR